MAHNTSGKWDLYAGTRGHESSEQLSLTPVQSRCILNKLLETSVYLDKSFEADPNDRGQELLVENVRWNLAVLNPLDLNLSCEYNRVLPKKKTFLIEAIFSPGKKNRRTKHFFSLFANQSTSLIKRAALHIAISGVTTNVLKIIHYSRCSAESKGAVVFIFSPRCPCFPLKRYNICSCRTVSFFPSRKHSYPASYYTTLLLLECADLARSRIPARNLLAGLFLFFFFFFHHHLSSGEKF